MSLRAYMATEFAASQIVNEGLEGNEVETIAGMACEMADALIAALEGKGPQA